MKLIYMSTRNGYMHPCEIESFKYNRLTDKYTVYYYDRSRCDYCIAHLKMIDGEYYVIDNDSRAYMNLPKALFDMSLENCDISLLPPYIRFINDKNKNITSKFVEPKPNHGYILKKKIDYLEIKSYEDALNGVKYYYFIVDDMEPTLDGFRYVCDYSLESKVPLKKTIIGRHEISIPLNDVDKIYGKYCFEFKYDEHLDIDMSKEKILVKKIMELNKGKRDDMDPVLLTKIVRMILASDDQLKAAREYKLYLHKYYDKWVEEKNEKHL